MAKMNKDIKVKWIEALRSGEYKQTIDSLKDTNGYCCLGVLCELYTKDTGMGGFVDKPEDDDSFYFDSGKENDDNLTGVPPNPVLDWASLKESNPTITIDGKETSVAILNDDGKTFDEMADIIDKHL